ncbi:Mitochondrial GTPase [Mortierella sp. AM989]|nr:Mitochondrial GTPase [Mortierella sp. AM989]
MAAHFTNINFNFPMMATSYLKLYNVKEPTDDIRIFLPQVAKYIGALKKGGEYNLTLAAQFLIKQYRLGKLGRFTLDDIRPESLEKFLTKEIEDPVSRRQQKKANKIEERRLKRMQQLGKAEEHEPWQPNAETKL